MSRVHEANRYYYGGHLLGARTCHGPGGSVVIRGLELTPVFPTGNKLISLPPFVATVVTASFYFGYLRIYTGSVWPASIAHSVPNAAWGALGAFTATSYPVIMNKYLVGDYGIFILVGAVIGAAWVGRRFMGSGPDEPRPSVASSEAPAA